MMRCRPVGAKRKLNWLRARHKKASSTARQEQPYLDERKGAEILCGEPLKEKRGAPNGAPGAARPASARL